MSSRRAFARGRSVAEIEWMSLSDAQRKRFCEEVLTSVGVARWTATSTGELVHSCPDFFHLHARGDRNPSAALSWKKGLWNCLGCGNGGSMAWFIAMCKGIGMDEARSQIAALGPDGSDLNEVLSFFDRLWSRKDDIVSMPKYSLRVLEPWMNTIHPYLTDVRKVPREQIVRFAVGYDPQHDRIVIPHFWEEDLVGWQSRRLTNDGSPKYKNSIDFPRDRTIYNFQRGSEETVVVESPMSVLVRSDHPNVEATFGAAVTQKQMRLLSSHLKVVLAMDNDEAGWNAIEQMGGFLSNHTDVWVIDNRWDADLADLTSDQFHEAMGNMVPYSIWRRPTTLEPV